MIKSKSAIFFTIIAFVFIEIFLISYKADVEYSELDKMNSIKWRVNMINDFMDSMEQDAQRSLYISGFRGVYSLNNYVVRSGNKIDVQDSFNEVMVNGTVGDNETAGLMDNQTLDDWVIRIEDIADDMALNLTLNVNSYYLEQDGPWTLKVGMNYSYTIVDNKGVANWNRTTVSETILSIAGWEDPLYSLRTGGFVRNMDISNVTSWNSEKLFNHMMNETYTESSDGANFLDRLENKTTSATNGIEALINPNDIENMHDKSLVDYIFFDLTNTTAALNVTDITNETYPKFRLDTSSCIKYGVVCW